MKKILFLFLIALSLPVWSQWQQKTTNPFSSTQTAAPDAIYKPAGQSGTWGIDGSTLAYINVDFENGVFPPAGWTVDYTGTIYWTLVSTCSGFGVGTNSAKFNFYSATTGTTQSLVTSTFTPAVAGDSLKFDEAYATYQTENDQLLIETSTDGGTTWTTLVTLNGGTSGQLVTAPAQTAAFTPTATQWQTLKFALAVGVNKIRFKAVSAYGNNLYVDNIRIGTPSPNDVGVFSLDISVNQTPGVVSPKATVKNFGSATQTFTVRMNIGAGYNSTKTVTSLAPGATQQVTFDNWTATLGTFALKVFTQLSGDANTANDTLNATVNVASTSWISGANITTATYLPGSGYYMRNDTAWVFVIGGNTTNKNENQIYNVKTNSWSQGSVLPTARILPACAVVKDTLFVLGGSDGTNYVNTIYKYNIRTNLWTVGGTLPSTRAWHKAVTYQDSLIYILGGLDLASGGTYQTIVWVYNTLNGTIRECSPLPAGTIGAAVAITGNTIVYVGGANASAIVGTTYVGTISSTDRSVITWTTGAVCPVARYKMDATPWANGSIIFSGGNDGGTGGYWIAFPETYTYKVSTNTWTQQLNKTTAILGAGVGGFQFANGSWKYVVASGYAGSAATNVTEIFVDDTYVPVELNSFTSVISENNVVLNWSTATEKNNNGFFVERKSGNDNWQSVGFVKGVGTSTEAQSYSFTDRGLSVGTYTYRLKQVDLDGSFAYSKEIFADLTVPAQFSLDQNYPNPFNPATTIKFGLATDSKVMLRVFDVTGQEVMTLINKDMKAGHHEVSFNASKLNSGVYFYKLEAGNFSSIKKMMLIK